MNNARTDSDPGDVLLDVDALSAGFETDAGFLGAIDRVSLRLRAGESLGLVGESGCGKSVTAHSILQLLPRPAGRLTGGSVRYGGRDLVGLDLPTLRSIRGREIGMIFQEPMTALNPVRTIGSQLVETVLRHEKVSKREARDRAIEDLALCGISAPADRFVAYPHQLSGGMRQRVVIAMALACRPRILIADEPTTALDVTTQAQIFDLLRRLREELGMSLLLITHDLGVVAENCDTVAVMYAGRIAERAPAGRLFDRPLHRYTRGLLGCIPDLAREPKTLLPSIPGSVPGLADLPVGARFAPRSDHPGVADYLASEEFRTVSPELVEAEPEHWVEDCEYVRA